MQNKKEKFINKFVRKNYEKELENLLENKQYSEDVKSLLLSVLYKIEDAYKDYKIVKKDVPTKEQYIETFIEIISQKCDNISFINIKEDKKITKVDINSKKIECYPIEKEVLYCIAEINKKENIVKNKIELINKSMTNLINNGNNVEFVEPLRDFNGWSWNVDIADEEGIEYNLIYQIIRMIVGCKFLMDWIKNSEKIIDYFEYFENELESKYGEEIAENIIENIIILSMLLDIKENENQKNKWLEQKQIYENEYKILDDKKQYVLDITNEKKKIAEKIKEIDQKINDREKLKEEYKIRNEKLEFDKKIFSLRVLEKILKEERNNLVLKIKECNKKMKPKNYEVYKKQIEKEVRIFSTLDNEDIESLIMEYNYKLEKNYIECLKIKIKNAKTKEELLNLLYELRYFGQIPYDLKSANFYDKKICNESDEIFKVLIYKCINNNIIINIGLGDDIYKQIEKIIFSTKIIKLEDINIKIEKNEEYYIEIYDDSILEKSYNFKIQENNKFDDNILNKKIKLISM